MLSKKAATAIAKVGKVHQRAFSLCGVKRGEIAALSEEDRKGLQGVSPDQMTQEDKDIHYPQIGNRDIVGNSYSINFDYHDMIHHPLPSVRWAKNTDEVVALRKKELNDWNTLTLEEKKQLYRNSFCQTFAEFTAPTGNWKRISFLILYTMFVSVLVFVYNLEAYGIKPKTLNEEYQQDMLAGMLMKNVGPEHGLSSKYDFEKNQWK